MALHLDMLPGESVTIGDSRIIVGDKSGKRVRLSIQTTAEVVHRKADAPALSPPPKATEPAAAPVLQRPYAARR